jgi:hypothetical protein
VNDEIGRTCMSVRVGNAYKILVGSPQEKRPLEKKKDMYGKIILKWMLKE